MSRSIIIGLRALLLLLLATPTAARADGPRVANGEVSQYAGAYGTSVPIVVPPYHGLQPNISLSYSSGEANGFVGVGWSLHAGSYIQRSAPGGGAPAYSAGDSFFLDGEELVPCTLLGGTHCTRTQSYQRIVYDATTTQWTVTLKDGTRSTYAPLFVTAAGIFRWGVSQSRDTHGNEVDFTYGCDSGIECYLQSIHYPGTQINFAGETRPDPVVYATGGALASMNVRLKTIDVLSFGSRGRSYQLVYGLSGTPGGRSMLERVQQFGRDAVIDATGTITGGSALPPQSFAYAPGSTALSALGQLTLPAPAQQLALLNCDLNGDGKSDLVQLLPNSAGHLAINTFIADATGHSAGWSSADTGLGAAAKAWLSGDVNGDGRGDVIQVFDNAGTATLIAYVSDGATLVPHATNSVLGSSALAWLTGDSDGDGLTDVIELFDAAGALGVAVFRASGDGTFTIASSVVVPNSTATALRFATGDLDGDGKSEIIQLLDNGGHLASLVLGPSASGYAARWTSADMGGSSTSLRWLFGDVNGDGMTDLIQPYDDAVHHLGVAVYLSNGLGFQLAASHDDYGVGGQAGLDFLLGDVNGDGRADLIEPYVGATGIEAVVLSSNGLGLDLASTATNLGPGSGSHFFFTDDQNGDGKVDLGHIQLTSTAPTLSSVGASFNGGALLPAIDVSGSTLTFHFVNNGQSWAVPITVAGTTPVVTDGRADTAQCRDGLISGITASGSSVSIHMSDTLQPPGTGGHPDCGAITIDFPGAAIGFSSVGCYFGSTSLAVSDNTVTLAGACFGSTKVVSQSFTVSGTLGAASESTIIAGGAAPDLLASSVNSLGGTTTIAYLPSSSYANTYLPLGVVFPVVSQVTIADGRGVAQTQLLNYAGGLWSNVDRRFLGFRHVTATVDAQGDYSDTYYHQHVGCVEKPEVSYLRAANGAIYKYEQNIYTENATPPYTSLLTDRWDFECEQGANCRRVLSQFDYDEFGNVLAELSWGDYDVSGDERMTLHGYQPNRSAYIVNAEAYEETFAGLDTSATIVRQTLLLYDNLPYFTAPTLGSLTGKLQWNGDTASYVTTSMTYDGFGNLVATTDPLQHTQTLSYDPTAGVYNTGSCNALGQCMSFGWDYALSAQTTTTDTNQQVTTRHYDALGRMVEEDRPDGSWTTHSWPQLGVPGKQHEHVVLSDSSKEGLWNDSYFDGLGRSYARVRKGGDRQTTTYADARSLPQQQSSWTAVGETPQLTHFAYDAVGRPVLATLPDQSTIQNGYGVGFNIVIDPLARSKVTYLDAYGRVTQVIEQNGATPAVTSMQYNAVDEVRSTVDANGLMTVNAWDTLGRRRSVSDPNSGVLYFTYDDAARLIEQVDAKSQVIDLYYDAANRQVMKDYSSRDPEIWVYDEASSAFPIGRLTTALFADGYKTFGYDARGNTTAMTMCVSGDCRSFAYAFDLANRPSSIQYPDNDIIRYRYGSDGRLRQIPGYVSAFDYNARDQLVGVTYANGVSTTLGYDPARQWMTSADIEGPGGALWQATYTYDRAARIAQVSSTTSATSSLQLGYDDLDRLRTVSGGQSFSFDYDAKGNLTSRSDVGAYLYTDPNHPDAPTAAGARSFQYDANGNTITSAGRTFEWDENNRLTSASANGAQVSFAYDESGARVLKGDHKYFGALWETAPGSPDTAYVYAGPLLIAKRSQAGKTYYHADHLGSVHAMTDDQGAALQLVDYQPFGAKLAAGATDEDFGFDQQRHDAETGLIQMGDRYYDSTVGRFLSCDSLVPNSLKTQAYNRYAFAYNNPISNSDPSGHDPDSFDTTTGSTWSWSSADFTSALTYSVDSSVTLQTFNVNDLSATALGFMSGGTTPSFSFTSAPGMTSGNKGGGGKDGAKPTGLGPKLPPTPTCNGLANCTVTGSGRAVVFEDSPNHFRINDSGMNTGNYDNSLADGINDDVFGTTSQTAKQIIQILKDKGADPYSTSMVGTSLAAIDAAGLLSAGVVHDFVLFGVQEPTLELFAARVRAITGSDNNPALAAFVSSASLEIIEGKNDPFVVGAGAMQNMMPSQFTFTWVPSAYPTGFHIENHYRESYELYAPKTIFH